MEATCFFGPTVGFQRTTRRYTPEDLNLYNHRRENFKSYIMHGEVERIWKEILMAYFKKLSRHSLGEAKENREETQAG
jgi:hypothetical protein